MTDPHGGVAMYVKNSIIYTRRHDLELSGIECIGIEVIFKQKRLLFGLFYRPNSDQIYHSTEEDSIHLAVDTGIKDIVTGDFNYNMLNDTTKRKISGICQQFTLVQCINEPTHFRETSCSLTDLVLVSTRNSIISCGVGDPFLHQNICFHYPVCFCCTPYLIL